jgi:hypothetical protein
VLRRPAKGLRRRKLIAYARLKAEVADLKAWHAEKEKRPV